jgi:RNase adaptor protein for sRNA GlmZ degradation
MSVYALREQIRERVAPRAPGTLSIMIESFGYKNGLPANADFVFDVRCLPNPYWEPQLRPLSGKDAPVRAFLDSEVERYRDTMQRYGRMLAALEKRKVRLALYYPLVEGGFREVGTAPPVSVPTPAAGTQLGLF